MPVLTKVPRARWLRLTPQRSLELLHILDIIKAASALYLATQRLHDPYSETQAMNNLVDTGDE